jgi:SAM-dependent methyltransferase
MEDLEAWDRAAASYATKVGVDGDTVYQRFRPFLWRHLVSENERGSVLDLGCGHGWLSGEIRARGAEVVGVDGSGRLLDIARRDHPDIRFEQADLIAGIPPDIEAIGFDRVVSHMVVMDLPDLAALGRSLSRCLRPNGRVVITLLHPAFFLQPPYEDPETDERYRKVRGYLRHEEWWIESFGGHRHYHRPLGFYVNWLAAAGFGVVELFEPPVPGGQSEYERWFAEIPTMLGLVAVPIG